jgi:hypothetical protein
MKTTRLAFAIAIVLPACLVGCDRTPKDNSSEGRDAAPIATASVPDHVPPAAPFNATPVAQFIDAGDLDTQSPFAQARVFEAQGQLWMARLVLERKALADDATKDETELLVKICEQQNDGPCLEACGKKLGRKIKHDGGAPSGAGRPTGSAGLLPEHKEPDSELARARDLVLKMQYEPARKALEPKVLDGKASREEIRMLKTICEKQGDKMCIALCETKLK